MTIHSWLISPQDCNRKHGIYENGRMPVSAMFKHTIDSVRLYNKYSKSN